MKNMTTKKVLSLLLVMVLMTGSALIFAEGISIPFQSYSGDEENPGVIDDDLMEYLAAYIKTNYYKEITDEELQEAVYKGIFETLDPHSKYFTKREFDEFMIDTGGSFGGIGIYIQEKDGFVEVISPIEDTPGERAGLKPQDLVVEIDGIDVSTITFEKALDMMRGDEGTEVQLGVKKFSTGEVESIQIVREIIKVNPVKHEVKTGNIGYLRIVQFNQQTAEKVKEVLHEFTDQGITDLIIDVRGNPGGYLDQVITVADFFVEKGEPIIHEQYNDKKTTTYAEGKPFDFDIAVLIDKGSASASEILAGAIKDHKLGTLVGTTTFGKGTVQTTRQLNTGAGMKLTIAEYLTAGDLHIDGKGIEPDVEIEGLTEESLMLVEDFVPMIEDKVYKVGSRGLDVYGMQQRLEFLGYEIDVDGKFGPASKAVLVQFQKDYGITTTGLLDSKTEQKILDTVEAILNGDVDPQLDKAIEILKNS